MVTRVLRQWWTSSNDELLLRSQDELLKALVRAPVARTRTSGPLNGVEFAGNPSSDRTCVLAHGFGSGLGFFFRNVDPLLESGRFRRVVMFDWLGMGGSDRPSCRQRPVRSFMGGSSSWCNSRYTPLQAADFFIDPLHAWLEEQNIERAVLVGHSMGGYLTARYALKYPGRVDKLVLASPVGFPEKPIDALPRSSLSPGLRLVDTLWSANVTPQQLVRLMGSTRGRRNVGRALRGRIPHLPDSAAELLAEYLYHITVAHPSGEFAMNSLLEPVASPETMGVFAREPLHERLAADLDPSISVSIIFGDKDWMRASPNEESAQDVVQRLRSTSRRPPSSFNIVPDAGHHLYLDNSQQFVHNILM